jgi:hypothetical protein
MIIDQSPFWCAEYKGSGFVCQCELACLIKSP